jgi:hypothetical protein
MTVEEIIGFLDTYRKSEGDSPVFARGRAEGHSDVAWAFARAMGCESEKLNLTGLLYRARELYATSGKTKGAEDAP